MTFRSLQLYSGLNFTKVQRALRYLTSNKTEVCGSRLLYLPQTYTHTHTFQYRRMSGTDVVLILTYTCLLRCQPCEKINSVSQFKIHVKAGIHYTTFDHFFAPNCSPLVFENQSHRKSHDVLYDGHRPVDFLALDFIQLEVIKHV